MRINILFTLIITYSINACIDSKRIEVSEAIELVFTDSLKNKIDLQNDTSPIFTSINKSNNLWIIDIMYKPDERAKASEIDTDSIGNLNEGRKIIYLNNWKGQYNGLDIIAFDSLKRNNMIHNDSLYIFEDSLYAYRIYYDIKEKHIDSVKRLFLATYSPFRSIRIINSKVKEIRIRRTNKWF